MIAALRIREEKTDDGDLENTVLERLMLHPAEAALSVVASKTSENAMYRIFKLVLLFL